MSLISPALLEILRCPVCHAGVTEDVPASALVCAECGRRYPVVDGIPDMVVAED
jgi:uncharacterized protein YbaR (Trm112 family)